MGSSKLLQLPLSAPWMSVPHFTAVHPIVVQTFQSGTKWGSHAASETKNSDQLVQNTFLIQMQYVLGGIILPTSWNSLLLLYIDICSALINRKSVQSFVCSSNIHQPASPRVQCLLSPKSSQHFCSVLMQNAYHIIYHIFPNLIGSIGQWFLEHSHARSPESI